MQDIAIITAKALYMKTVHPPHTFLAAKILLAPAVSFLSSQVETHHGRDGKECHCPTTVEAKTFNKLN